MGKLVIVSGGSGCGKTSIMRRLMDNEIVSTTTRAPRQGEEPGVDYHFVSQEQFAFIRDNDGFAEYSTYYGTASYGITKEEIRKKLGSGDAFVIVDVEGKQQLDEVLGVNDTVSVLIRTYGHVARERMERRGDSPDRIDQRMITFEEEMENYFMYDYILDNITTFEDALERMKLILAENGITTR